ncbi:hypothetical protein ACI2L1_07315 [Streptomyces sp. NPDC019531]|uniref:hypothetical protein n=1 Tax=Streptomyces sp. NPDC019531 TaxID=3365062 RepID=UPI00384C6179
MGWNEERTIDGAVYAVLSVIAGALVLIGICGLLLGVNADASGGESLKCGTAVTGVEGAITYDAVQAGLPERAVDARAAACESAINTRRMWAWPATGAGAVGCLVLVYLVPFVRPKPDWAFSEVRGIHR